MKYQLLLAYIDFFILADNFLDSKEFKDKIRKNQFMTLTDQTLVKKGERKVHVKSYFSNQIKLILTTHFSTYTKLFQLNSKIALN